MKHLFSSNYIFIGMRFIFPMIFLFFLSCNSGANNDSQKVNVSSISAKKNDDKFTVCLASPIPQYYSRAGVRMVNFELLCTYKNGNTYKTEGVLAAEDTTQTCFIVGKILGKWQYSDKRRIERDKIFEEFSNENFKNIRIALMDSKYLELDTLSVRSFNF